MQVELHPQLRGLNSVLQLLVLSRLRVHRSIRRLEGGRDVELCLLGLLDQEQKIDRSSSALVGCRKVFQPLKLGGLICGILLHIVGYEHCLAHQLSGLQLRLLVPAYPQPHRRLGDGWKVRHHEHVHEHVEIGLLQRVLFLSSEVGQLSEVHYSQLQVLRRGLPASRRPGSQAVGKGVVCTEVCLTGRSVEVPAVPQEGLEELLRVRGEFVNGLVLACYLLGSGKELIP